MTQLLVKTFIKDYKNTQLSAVRTKYGVLASIVGIVCNIILFGIKAVIGFMIGSISVTADAFNNLSDAASSVISFAGVKLASRPADKEHPFGHGRYEYLAALAVAFLVLEVGFTCFKSALGKVFSPEPMEFQPILVAILGASILIKIWLGLFNRSLGNQINSNVMKATAADAFGDVAITSVTVLSIIIGKMTGWEIDGYMGIVVSGFVLYAGISIAKDTLEPILGQAVSRETYELITKKVESYKGIVGSHDLVVHNYGPTHIMATIHAEVPIDMNMGEAHDLIDMIERDVLRELDIFLVIHMDPMEINNELVNRLKKEVLEIVKSLEPNASIHDFRVVSGEVQHNIIFDLVVPHEYEEEKENELIQEISSKMEKLEEGCQCKITLEHGFLSEEG